MTDTSKYYTETLLSSKITIAQYLRMVDEKDRAGIALFLYERFYERYFLMLKVAGANSRNGFGIMANCALMIETLESFRNGLENTKQRGAGLKCFQSFFSREAQLFPGFDGEVFYTHIRCGILHQAETTGGWKIRRRGALLEKKTINSFRFLKAMEGCLNRFCKDLHSLDWKDALWVNVRKKVSFIIKNCE